MNDATKASGFYGTQVENYYIAPSGRVWAYGSDDFDGVREIDALPEGAVEVGKMVTPDEAVDIIGQIEAESGESILDAD